MELSMVLRMSAMQKEFKEMYDNDEFLLCGVNRDGVHLHSGGTVGNAKAFIEAVAYDNEIKKNEYEFKGEKYERYSTIVDGVLFYATNKL